MNVNARKTIVYGLANARLRLCESRQTASATGSERRLLKFVTVTPVMTGSLINVTRLGAVTGNRKVTVVDR